MISHDCWTVIATRPVFGRAKMHWMAAPDAPMTQNEARAAADRGEIWMMQRHTPDCVELVVRLSKGAAEPALFKTAHKRPDLDAAYDRGLRSVMGGQP